MKEYRIEEINIVNAQDEGKLKCYLKTYIPHNNLLDKEPVCRPAYAN